MITYDGSNHGEVLQKLGARAVRGGLHGMGPGGEPHIVYEHRDGSTREIRVGDQVEDEPPDQEEADAVSD